MLSESPAPPHTGPELALDDGLLKECTDTRRLSEILDVFAANIARELETEQVGPGSASSRAARGGNEGTAVPAASCKAPGADFDWEKSLLKECTDKRPVSEIIEAFASNIDQDAEVAAVERWGEKVGYSIFDEDEVLGVSMDFDDEDDDDYFTDDGEDSDLESEHDDLYNWLMTAEIPGRAHWQNSVPRAVKLIEPLCCVYTLERDLQEQCAICLEPLSEGQGAWRLPCTHTFHEACAMRFFGARHVRACCPICRSDIKRFGAACSVCA